MDGGGSATATVDGGRGTGDGPQRQRSTPGTATVNGPSAPSAMHARVPRREQSTWVRTVCPHVESPHAKHIILRKRLPEEPGRRRRPGHPMEGHDEPDANEAYLAVGAWLVDQRLGLGRIHGRV